MTDDISNTEPRSLRRQSGSTDDRVVWLEGDADDFDRAIWHILAELKAYKLAVRSMMVVVFAECVGVVIAVATGQLG